MLRSGIIITLCLILEHGTRLLLSEFIELNYNPGAAFGIFREMPGIVLVLSVMGFAVIIYLLSRSYLDTIAKTGISITAGGALSNLLERIILGNVIDWIPVPFIDLYFNLADLEISLGVLIMFLSVMKSK